MTRRTVEIDTLDEFDAHLARTRRLSGWFVRALDLSARGHALAEVNPRVRSSSAARSARPMPPD